MLQRPVEPRVFTACMLAVALVCRERVPVPTQRERFSWRTFVAPLRTRALRTLLGMYLCQALAMDIVSATVLYYALYVVPGANSQVFLGIFIAVNVVAFPVVTWLVGRISKTTVYATLIPLALLAAVGIAVYPAGGAVVGVYVLALALAVGMAGAQLMSWVMFPDVLDAAELGSGQRNAGSYAGLMTFTRGIASALVIQALGLVLQFTGYVAPGHGEAASQPTSAVWGIRVFMGVGIIALLSLGWVVSRRHPLTRDVCLANQAELARVREARDAPLVERHHDPGE